MASKQCNTAPVKTILSSINGAANHARSEALSIASIVREARSVASASNIAHPRLATTDLDKLGDLPDGATAAQIAEKLLSSGLNPALGSPNDGSDGGPIIPSYPWPEGTPKEVMAEREMRIAFDLSVNKVDGVLSSRGALFQGLRNRLALKYLGIDYEFRNVHDIKYRTA